ncbi:MAG: AAA family ATPase [Pseudomonadota bacterium]
MGQARKAQVGKGDVARFASEADGAIGLRMSVTGFVIVSGLPASGKTALGRAVAERLAIPFLDKDDFLEKRFAAFSEIDADLRQRLSRESDTELASNAAKLSAGVLVSFWRPRGEAVSYGTPTDWIADLPEPVVELHCRCRPDIARERFAARMRHPGHNDATRLTTLGQQFEELAGLGPLGGWPCVELETSDLSGFDALVDVASDRLRNAFADAS